MPVQPTYPGVYIEEIPSGVRTITGVATSITAYIGYTTRGAVKQVEQIFSFADFERGFGGLAPDSPLSHTVKHFFQNGGNEACIVRVAADALAASVVLQNQTKGGKDVVEVTAASEGNWGNNLRIGVDYGTSDPASLFNLTATELTQRNGPLEPGQSEVFRKLSMNSRHPNFVTNIVNAASSLISVALPAGFKIDGQGSSTSGVIALADVALTPGYRLAYTLNGQGPFEISIATPTNGDTLDKKLDAIAKDVEDAIKIASPPGVSGSGSNGHLTFKAVTDDTHPVGQSAIHFQEASTKSAAKQLMLRTENGGTEPDAAGPFRPAPTGTAGMVAHDFSTAPDDGALDLEVFHGGLRNNPAPNDLNTMNDRAVWSADSTSGGC